MDNVNLADMFTYYQYYLLASNPKHSLVEELKRQFKIKIPTRYWPILKNLSMSIKIYMNLQIRSQIVFGIYHGVFIA
ncbi:hypothetical protein AB8U03_09705 [Clostridium sp. Mt-5]|uniref:Uncharacterized protein n=1 Tax=Clostridium moutaii TaxID=3240932 RepID=A0ABV4BUE7_9CLOT